ncbi:MAG: hypothetical protein FJZ57_08420, partial [Chlamydiae bacterium]|nr:hypothetical protein [Chlamydiota bacterium]
MTFIGIYTEDRSIKFAKLRKEKKEIFIDLLRSVHKEDETSHVEALQQLETPSNKNFTTTSGLDASEVLIRILQMKLSDKKKIISALPFQLEGVIPFPWEESITAPLISKKSKDNYHRITTVTTKKSYLENHILSLEQWGIDPENTSSVPNALQRFSQFFHPEEQDLHLFHIGSSSSCALCIIDSEIEISYPFHFGINDLLEAVESDYPEKTKENILEIVSNIDFQQIDPIKQPHIAEILFQLQKEIDRIHSYFQNKIQNKKINKTLLCGSFARIPKLREYIKAAIPNEFTILEHKPAGSYDASTLEAYCVPVGLALDSCLNDERTVQFRQKDFISKKAFKKKIKLLNTYLAYCAALTMSAFILGKIEVAKNEKKLKALCSHYFPDQTISGNINQQISSIEKKIGKGKKASALIIPLPAVSEVLAWLSSHPKLSKSTDSLIPFDLVEIKHFKYNIVKYPQINNPNSQSVAKVDVEFSSPSSRVARDFHDSLLKGDHIVD